MCSVGIDLKELGVSCQNAITIHQRYRQTDRQTDGMRSQNRALH